MLARIVFVNFQFCLAFLLVDVCPLYSGSLSNWLHYIYRFAACESLSTILLGAGAPDFIGWQIKDSFPQ